MKTTMRHIFFLISFSSIFLSLPGQTTTVDLGSTQLEVRVVASNLFIPWDLVWGPYGWIWFTERDGKISRLNPSTGEIQLIHRIEEIFESHENSGLQSMVLDPEFPVVPYLYVHYSYERYKTRLVRYTYDLQHNSLTDSVHILPTLPGNSSHNGSRLLFAPDHTLFFAFGDTYRNESVQNLQDPAGSILHINPDGSVPEDNPISGNRAWTWGHRNPQGMIMTPSGNLYASEHGLSRDDELNLIQKGRNYGWPDVAGYCDKADELEFCQDSNVVEPLITWSTTAAPGGLDFYDHPAIPEWRNSLLQVFLKAGTGKRGQRMEQLRLNASGDSIVEVNSFFTFEFGRLRDVLVTPDGRVFISTSNREHNGREVVKEDDDKIIEIRNPAYPLSLPPTVNLAEGEIKVFPNPTEEIVHLIFPVSEGTFEISLLDLTGRKLIQEEITLDGIFHHSLTRDNIQNGLYLVEIITPDGEIISRRIQFQ